MRSFCATWRTCKSSCEGCASALTPAALARAAKRFLTALEILTAAKMTPVNSKNEISCHTKAPAPVGAALGSNPTAPAAPPPRWKRLFARRKAPRELAARPNFAQRAHQFGEGAANRHAHAHAQINHVATRDELAEFFEHKIKPNRTNCCANLPFILRFWRARCRGRFLGAPLAKPSRMIHESPSSLPVPHIGGVSLPLETVNQEEKQTPDPHTPSAPRPAKLWMPDRAIFTRDALQHEHGERILERVERLGIAVEKLRANAVRGLKQEDVRKTYAAAKRTLIVAVSPPSYLKLSPIPPSADWQFHLAEGCPAHCQYCYLAGSLSGPPVVRVYANLDEILGNLAQYETMERRVARPRGWTKGVSPTAERGREDSTSFEVSCYTDPLGIEHLTGSLSQAIRYFGTRERGFLRSVSKFDDVDDLLDLPHNGQTRFRASVNAEPISRRLEGGTANVPARLQSLRKLALAGYPIGLVIAPIMPMDDWRAHYTKLLDEAAAALDVPCDLTFELITHRFTPGSKDVLLQWYPNTSLDLDESNREVKRNKFGGQKYVYPRETMNELKTYFAQEIEARFPQGKILYWT